MAFPTINGTQKSSSPGTTQTLKLPVLSTGDLLFAWLTVETDDTITPPSGWTLFLDDEWIGGIARRSVMCYRVVTGSEGYTGNGTDTVTYAQGDIAWGAHVVYSITGAADPDVQLPTYSRIVGGSADPPNHSPGSTKDFLWVAAISGRQNVESYPSGYSDGIGIKAGNASIGIAAKELNASSENPGVFTLFSGDTTVTYTLAFWPVPPVTLTIEPTLVQSLATPFNPSLSYSYNVDPGLVDSSITVFDPSFVMGEVIISPSLSDSSAVVFDPVIGTSYSIIVDLANQAAVVYDPVVSLSSPEQFIDPGLEQQLVAVFDPVVQAGTAYIVLTTVENLAQAFGVVIEGGKKGKMLTMSDWSS